MRADLGSGWQEPDSWKGCTKRRRAALLAAAVAACWWIPTSSMAADASPVAAEPGEIAAGLTPAEAARAMTAPPGFAVQLAAGEPLVHQPVALAYDERGRLWVAEAHTYPQRAPEGQGRDRILILEDQDLDGVLETRKVFAEGLNLVSGLEVGFGGAWVGAAPYLLFIPDRDGDDRPDGPPETVLDGFGYQDTHETLNAFIWGPDGWLYGCHGVFTHSLVGPPGAADSQRTPLNAGVWRFHPLRRKFEVFAWGTSNPWGVDFNDQGQAFITACVIPHLYHVIQGARYQRQAGAHFEPYTFDDIKTIADHAHYAGNLADHAWWGHAPVTPQDTLAKGGGHAHCGAMIYLGDDFPAEYRGRIFMNNVHGNRVNCDVLEPHGSGYVGRHGPDLLLANDRWFRGINLRYGPDGAVHMIDWYDKEACHRHTPEIWDRSNGRVYRLSTEGRRPVRVDLRRLADEDLVELQTHENDWYVRTARRLLQERQDVSTAALARLRALAGEEQPERVQLRALWALHALNATDEALLLERTAAASPYVRGWAVQLLLERGSASPAASARLVEMARGDESPVVRLYLASALQRLGGATRRDLAWALAQHGEDADDHNLPLMLWYGVEPLVPEGLEWALDLAQATRLPLVQRFVYRRAAAERALLPQLVARLAAEGDRQRQTAMLGALAEALSGQADVPAPPSWAAAFGRALHGDDSQIRDLAVRVAVLLGDRQVAPWLREMVASAQEPVERRRQAIEGLVRLKDAEAPAALVAALDDAALARPALQALAAFGDESIAAAILARYPAWDVETRRDAVQTLASRVPSALRLLEAVEAAAVSQSDLSAVHVRQLRALNDETVTARIEQLWGGARETPAEKLARIEQLKRELQDAPTATADDLQSGRQLFAKHCATCHTLFGEGAKIGPDLTGSNRASLDYLLENLVDPSALVGRDYASTLILTDEGRTLLGLVAAESDSAVTLQTATEQVVVPKREIELRETSDVSLMPEGILDTLSGAELRQLRAYLALPAPLATPLPAAEGQSP